MGKIIQFEWKYWHQLLLMSALAGVFSFVIAALAPVEHGPLAVWCFMAMLMSGMACCALFLGAMMNWHEDKN